MNKEINSDNAYSRLIALEKMEIVEDYEKIRDFTVVIVGIGGVGSVAAEMLTRCGIGRIILYDYDKVELANMNRMFYLPSQKGMYKVDAAKETLLKITQDVDVIAHPHNILSMNHYEEFKQILLTGGKQGSPISLLLSCVDNYAGRMGINSICNELGIVWMESGVSENAMSGHIQFMVPGETACFKCASPLVCVENEDEGKIKREGVCAASLPTTMSIIAGFLVQNTLKYLLNFGEVSLYLGYNSVNDFFMGEPIYPNPACEDSHCKLAQQKVAEMEKKDRLLEKIKWAGNIQKKEEEKKIPQQNEWGIEILEEDIQENKAEETQYAQVEQNSSLEDLMSKLQNLQKS